MKPEWIINNSDMVYLAGSFAFLQLAIICQKVSRQSSGYPQWQWIAWSSVSAALALLIQMITLSLKNDLAIFLSVLLLLAHLAALTGFASQLPFRYQPGVSWRTSSYLPAAQFIVSVGILWQTSLTIALLCASSVTLMVLLLSAYRTRKSNRFIRLSQWLLCVYGITLVVSATVSLRSSDIASIVASAISAIVISAVCVLLGCFYHNNEQLVSSLKAHTRNPALWLAAAMVTLFLAGWPAVSWMGMREDVRQRRTLLDASRDMAKTVDLYHVKELTATAADLNTPQYKRVKANLQIMQQNVPNSRFVYLMGIRNGRLRFLADSEDTGSLTESPPGQVYFEATKELFSVFSNSQAIVEGPVRDRWGIWISSAVPVIDPESNKLIAVLGMDMDAHSFQKAIYSERLKAVLLLYIALLSVHTVWFLRMQFLKTVASHEDLVSIDPILRWGSPLVIGIGVLAISFVVMSDARRIAEDSFDQAFRKNAATRVEALSETIDNSLDELAAFGRFYSYSHDVTVHEFAQYSDEMQAMYDGLEAVEWVPVVPYANLRQHESRLRAEGFSNYKVWQQGGTDEKVPVTPRSFYYPVQRLSRKDQLKTVLGYDLGSEQVRRTALLKAIQDRIPAATGPIVIVQERKSQKGFLVFVPVISREPDRGSEIIGFIVGVYRVGDLVNLALRNQPVIGLNVDVYDTGNAGRPLLLYSFKSQTLAYNPPLKNNHHTYYQMIEIAGRYWRLKVTPETAFIHVNYSRAYLWILPFGFQLALLSAFLTERLVTSRLRADLMVRRRTREVVAERERLNVTLRSIGDGVIATDATGRVIFMNNVAEGLVGWSEAEAVGRPFDDIFVIVNVKTRAPVTNPIGYAILTGNTVELARQTVLIARDGSEKLIADSAAPVRDASGSITGGILVFRDVTEEQARIAEINERDAFQRMLLENLPAGVLIVDAETHIIEDVNPSAAQMFGAIPSEIINRLCHQFLCPAEQGKCPVTDFEETLDNSDRLLVRADGSLLPILKSVKRIRIRGREKLLEMFVDITERKRAEDELSYKSTHDSLTGLFNRQHFEQELHRVLHPANNETIEPLVVAFIDLDKFKLINDTLGHKVGDQLLMEVAERLQLCLRENDVLARMGGDEFTLILSSVRFRSRAEMIATRIIESLSSPFEIRGARFVIGASIGLAQYPGDGKDVVTLLRHADAAMYKAKQAGRSTFRWYTGDVDRDNQSRVEIENDIRVAIETEQFQVYYQPIISLKTGMIYAAEALLRWDHPVKGMISPSLFIPIAEETGLIRPIGDTVLRSACTQLSAWKEKGLSLRKVCVNISTAQVRCDSWLESVHNAMHDASIKPQELVLELTESDFAIDYSTLKYTLQQVQEMGVGVAIDDFGMGYSSLSRIKDFALIHLKIDGSFVRNIEHNDSDKALLHSIIDMAHGQNMEVTAEWVETQSQIDLLQSNGCDYAQGYYISPPLAAAEFETLLRTYKPGQRAA